MAIDPCSEVICAAGVGAANAGDAAMAAALLADLPDDPGHGGNAPAAADAEPADQPPATTAQAPAVYGDAAYGTGTLLTELEQRGITAMTKVAAPTAPEGSTARTRWCGRRPACDQSIACRRPRRVMWPS